MLGTIPGSFISTIPQALWFNALDLLSCLGETGSKTSAWLSPTMMPLTPQAKDNIWKWLQLWSLSIPIIHLRLGKGLGKGSVNPGDHCGPDSGHNSTYYLASVYLRSNSRAMMLLQIFRYQCQLWLASNSAQICGYSPFPVYSHSTKYKWVPLGKGPGNLYNIYLIWCFRVLLPETQLSLQPMVWKLVQVQALGKRWWLFIGATTFSLLLIHSFFF